MNALKEKGLSYEEIEMILVGNHAPFTWGKTPRKSRLQQCCTGSDCANGILTEQINPEVTRLKDSLIKKHFERKHGPGQLLWTMIPTCQSGIKVSYIKQS